MRKETPTVRYGLLPVEIKQNPSALPTLTYRNWALNRGSHIIVELRESSEFYSCFVELNSSLSFVETAQIIQHWASSIELAELSILNKKTLLESFGYKFNHQLNSILEALNELPQGFLNWAAQKQLGPKDLMPLTLNIPELKKQRLLTAISRDDISKSVGVLLIELLVDLTLMSFSDEDLYLYSETPKHWLVHLKKMRTPLSTASDSLMESALKKISTPKEIQLGIQRIGDSTRITFSGTAKNTQELKKSLSLLIDKTSELPTR